MAITPEQRTKLEALAKERGLDVDELLAQAEQIAAARAKASPPAATTPPSPAAANTPTSVAAPDDAQPKLFQYHLPFVTVNEVRTKWLGLDAWDAADGGDDNAAAFAAAQAGAPAPSPPANETPERPAPTSVPSSGVSVVR